MNRYTPLLGAVAAVLLVIYVSILFTEGDRNRQAVAFPENPEELRIQHGQDEFVLRLSEDGWAVVPPGQPADEQTVREFLAPIRGDQRLLVASTGAEGSYGLSVESRISIMIDSPGEENAIALQLGAATGGGRYVYARIDGDPPIYLIDRRVREIAESGSAGIRDKVIRRLREDDIDSLRIEVSGASPVSITRRPEGEGTAPGTADLEGEVARIARTWQARGADLEPYQLENLFQEIRTLRANRFDGSIESGSGEPVARLTIILKDGGELPVELRAIRGGEYWVRGPGLPEDAVLLPWRARRLTLGLLEED